MTRVPADRGRRERGALLLEIMIALALLTIGLLGFLSAFLPMIRAADDASKIDQVQVALDNVTEQLRSANFATLYANFNGTSVPVSELKAPDGSTAQVVITCYVNEVTVPSQFGPILDLDGDGALSSANVSGNYRLLPVRLTLDYLTTAGGATREVFLVLSDSF